jgi:hypothetical protein
MPHEKKERFVLLQNEVGIPIDLRRKYINPANTSSLSYATN